jgi:hypothetical protein
MIEVERRTHSDSVYDIVDRLLPNEHDTDSIERNTFGAEIVEKELHKRGRSEVVPEDILAAMRPHMFGTMSEVVSHMFVNTRLLSSLDARRRRELLEQALRSDIATLEKQAQGNIPLPQSGDIFPQPKIKPHVKLAIRQEMLEDLTRGENSTHTAPRPHIAS